jgi:hypothetical protein
MVLAQRREKAPVLAMVWEQVQVQVQVLELELELELELALALEPVTVPAFFPVTVPATVTVFVRGLVRARVRTAPTGRLHWRTAIRSGRRRTGILGGGSACLGSFEGADCQW